MGKTLKIFIVILLFVGSSTATAVKNENRIENFKWTPIGEIASPTYRNVGTNTTVPGQSCEFYCYWACDGSNNLDTCLFATNNTGKWQTNQTVWSNAGVTGKWANVTKKLHEHNFPGTVVAYQFWANDTSGNWNTTSILTFTTTPVVYVYPRIASADVDETITISVVVEDLTNARIPNPWYPQVTLQLGNLYGFDIQFSWDPTILEYVDHTVTVPVEDYPDPIPPSPYPGILHEDFLQFKDKIDEDNAIPGAELGTMAWFTYTSIAPAPVTNGDGTLFTMTFKVKKKGACELKLIRVSFSDKDARPILYYTQDGIFRSASTPIADFTFSPKRGGVGESVFFDASNSSDPDGYISKYIWDFGDGNITEVEGNPEVSHAYEEAGDYTVSLTVEDNEGTCSLAVLKKVKIIGHKNVKVLSVSFSTPETRYEMVRVNRTFDIRTMIKNDGEVDERCTVIAFYNATPYWGNFSTTEWTEITRKEKVLPEKMPDAIPLDLHWNTTEVLPPKLETRYHVLVNITGVLQEENVEDNMKVSTGSVLITAMMHEDIVVKDLKLGWGSAFKHPVIHGEETSFEIAIWNMGTEDEDSINVTLVRDGIIRKSWNVSLPFGGLTEKLVKETLEPGYYNITALATIENDENPTDNRLEEILHVIGSPVLNFTYSPKKPLVGESVFFDASNSSDPDGAIVNYSWNFGDGDTTKVEGNPEVSHAYEEAGDYTVSLTVEDNYGITYKTGRGATASYRIMVVVRVESPTGFPIEYITLLVLIIVIIAVSAIVLYRRQTKT